MGGEEGPSSTAVTENITFEEEIGFSAVYHQEKEGIQPQGICNLNIVRITHMEVRTIFLHYNRVI